MDIYKIASELESKNEAFVIAFVVSVAGSSPGKAGFKMIIKSDGTTVGTVGGGAIEAEVIKEAKNRLLKGENYLKEYFLSDKSPVVKEDVKIVPMSCSGSLTVFYEVHGKLPTVYVFGGGHVGSALLYFLRPLKFFTVLVDNRKELISNEKNPLASEKILAEYDEYSKNFNPDEDSHFVIVTHGHKYDEIILKNIYLKKKNFSYVGVIASKSKAAGLSKSLKEEFGSTLDLSNLHSPIGLKIGGSTAEEIALGIAAEIQSIYYKQPQHNQ
ncbi:MAG: XdhC/CoxI family protein [Ignavibacteriaceae bacterium]|nr:XdhC/CoxI family protein [Ignavibacteriaceae bacterium]